MRPLLIAEAANPEWTSVPLEGWSHATAIQRLVGGHIATQIRNKPAFERAGMRPDQFTAIDSEAVAAPLHAAATTLRGGSNKGWTTVTAIQALAYPYFELQVWRNFRARLASGEFDVVHRLTPLSPTIPSFLAGRLARLGVPFILGPLNGGVAWPREFEEARRREKEWLSYIRGGYRYLPGYRSTRRHASAIICGSLATMEQMPRWCRDKCVYIPENAIDPGRFPDPGPKTEARPLRIGFVGRLVPYKGADMLIEASAPLLRAGRAVLDIIGDGPEIPRLRSVVSELEVESAVEFAGLVPHAALHKRLSRAHVFGFPSVREFGGAVVLEAMALRVVPIVLNYGGPGELVTDETGFRIPMSDRATIIGRLRAVLETICDDPGVLTPRSDACRRRAVDEFSWEAKARSVLSVYERVLRPRASQSGAADCQTIRC